MLGRRYKLLLISMAGRGSLKLLRFCLAVLAMWVPTLVLGATLPQQFIGTGADGYRGEQREFAEYALAMAKAGEGWNLVPLVWAGRVTEVKTFSTEGPCGYNPNVVGRHEAKVELYSLFGVPYGRASVDCGDPTITAYPLWDVNRKRIPNEVVGLLFYPLLLVRILWPLLALIVFAFMLIGGLYLCLAGANGRFDRIIGAAALVAATFGTIATAYWQFAIA